MAYFKTCRGVHDGREISGTMCAHDDVFDTWVGTHRCQTMPRRFWLGPVMVGRIDRTPFAHDGECGWAVGFAGMFAAWTGWAT